MKPPYEALSRLYAGEVTEDEAAALRRRIATEPEVARAWADLLGLTTALAALPEVPPPPELDARVLGAPLPRRVVPARPIVAAAAALVVGLGLGAWSMGDEPVRIAIVDGSQVVSGDARVLAGDLPVHVDGVSRITVIPARGEPGPGVVRAPGSGGGGRSDPEGDVNNKTTWAAALGGGVAGAIVTVAVIEGRATVDLPEGPVVVEAGEIQQMGAAAPDAVARSAPLPTDPVARVAALERENAALRAELEEAKFAGAVARGQVAATQGEAVPWTDDVPAGYRPEAFEALLRASVAKFPGFSVEAVDCAEYPCIATVRSTAVGPELQEQAKGLATAMEEGLPPGSSTWMGITSAEGKEGEQSAGIGLALAPEDALRDDGIRTRLDFRGQSLLRELEPAHPDE